MLELLEEVTDYINVDLNEKQLNRLSLKCQQWNDDDSIQSEINRFLQIVGYY